MSNELLYPPPSRCLQSPSKVRTTHPPALRTKRVPVKLAPQVFTARPVARAATVQRHARQPSTAKPAAPAAREQGLVRRDRTTLPLGCRLLRVAQGIFAPQAATASMAARAIVVRACAPLVISIPPPASRPSRSVPGCRVAKGTTARPGLQLSRVLGNAIRGSAAPRAPKPLKERTTA